MLAVRLTSVLKSSRCSFRYAGARQEVGTLYAKVNSERAPVPKFSAMCSTSKVCAAGDLVSPCKIFAGDYQS